MDSAPQAEAELSDAAKRWLLSSARRALAEALEQRGTPAPLSAPDPGPRPEDPALAEPSRLFVSWHLRGALHGCIGTLEPWPSLGEGVRRYAVIAGLGDRRTPDLDPGEFGALELEVSVLGEPRPLPEPGLRKIAAALVPHRDGVILSHRRKSAFFLPVVWQKLPEPMQFLEQLCQKAGIDPARHGAKCRAQVLPATSFSDTPAAAGTGV
jgi:AmmeMemoRadiSam system protein A